ncbi:uncharacterized protein LOC121782039 [Salvia splendens]|uniref:uncharacterized protein LOC121782039 n=1 Tax=Salvia splendens TaxID=180675 RepID=UPI001C255F95|nr:uncharacterized protein LOC121782039 [Salvia splendens]
MKSNTPFPPIFVKNNSSRAFSELRGMLKNIPQKTSSASSSLFSSILTKPANAISALVSTIRVPESIHDLQISVAPAQLAREQGVVLQDSSERLFNLPNNQPSGVLGGALVVAEKQVEAPLQHRRRSRIL